MVVCRNGHSADFPFCRSRDATAHCYRGSTGLRGGLSDVTGICLRPLLVCPAPATYPEAVPAQHSASITKSPEALATVTVDVGLVPEALPEGAGRRSLVHPSNAVPPPDTAVLPPKLATIFAGATAGAVSTQISTRVITSTTTHQGHVGTAVGNLRHRRPHVMDRAGRTTPY